MTPEEIAEFNETFDFVFKELIVQSGSWGSECYICQENAAVGCPLEHEHPCEAEILMNLKKKVMKELLK